MHSTDIHSTAFFILSWRASSKRSSQGKLIDMVQRAINTKQPLDDDCLVLERSTSNLYVTIETRKVLSTVEWNSNPDDVFMALRDDNMPKIDSDYINQIFGEGKNGI